MEETVIQPKIDLQKISGGALAYLGDAVLEVLIRQRVLTGGDFDTGRLNEKARVFERATTQSRCLEELLPLLSEEECAVFRRGRNGSGAHPKSATAQEYRRATGLEALFGYLHLTEQNDRILELFEVYAEGAQRIAEKAKAEAQSNE